MKNLKYLFFLFAICICNIACAHVVDKINVLGNKNFSDGAIRAYLKFDTGEELDNSKINNSIKALYATGFFTDVNIDEDGPIVYVNVKENPTLRDISIVGNRKVTSSDLKAAILHKPRDVFSDYQSKREIDTIKSIYARKGYVAIEVMPELIENENNFSLKYYITEGEPKFLTKIRFMGNKKYSDKRLKRVITSKEKSVFRILSGATRYDPDRIEFDEELLRIFYHNNGYVDFEIISRDVEADKNGNFHVTFNVIEGKKYVFGKIDINSELDYPIPDFGKKILTKSGDHYSDSRISDTINNITDILGDLGFAFVSISPKTEQNSETGVIDIQYIIKKSPKVYVDQINIHNNTRTLDRVIRREIKLDEGDPYNYSKVRRSIQKIKNLGYFNKVEHSVTSSREDRLNLEIDVEETSTGGLDFGASFSTAKEGLGGYIQLSERNFLGMGLDTNLKFSKSSKQNNVVFGLADPYFLGRNFRAGFKLFADESESGSETTGGQSSYKHRSIGATFSGGYSITEYLTHGIRYTIKDDKLTDIPSNASIFIKEQAGTNLHSAIGHSFIYNRLDDNFDPKSGYITSLVQDYAGVGGDINFFKNIYQLTGYATIIEDRLLVKGQFKAGIVNGHSGKNLRINDKFFLGPDDVRGFNVAGLGPRDRNTMDALGGSKFITVKTELIFPLDFGKEFGLKFYVFHDYGDLWGGITQSPDVLQTRNGRASYGYGFSLDTPLGPMVIDWGFPYEKESFDKTKKFRLSYRTPF